MGKWWILSAAFIGWMGLGYVVLEPPGSQVPSQTRRTGVPMRIVSLAPNLTEILFALGLDERIAGVTQDSDYPPAAAQKYNVGTFWQPSIEAVVAARSDLIVTLTFEQHRSLAARLTRMGYNCVSLDIWTVADLAGAITALGAATATTAQAQQLLDDIEGRLGALQDAWRGKDRVRTLWVVQREPLRVAGKDTFVNELIELAGGENAIGPTLHKYPPIGGEQVIASDAEVIIEPTMLGGDLEKQRHGAVAYWRRFNSIPAVSDGRICVIDGDLVSRLGPRLPEAVEAIAKCLRPELFGE